MSSRRITISRSGESIRLRPLPIASPAQIIRAILVGVLLAFLLVWGLPQGRLVAALTNGPLAVAALCHAAAPVTAA